MKRWFRPVAYSTIVILTMLAVFGGAPTDEAVAASVQPDRISTRAARPVATELPVVLARIDESFAPALFVAPARQAPVAPVAPVALHTPVTTPAPPELKMLGWMMSDSVPYVFVEVGGESYTLSPAQPVAGDYRFDRIGDGVADFSYLPTGQGRQYAVSDPAVIE